MSGNVFLDTNILVYSYSSSELNKQKIARGLMIENNSFISTQVLQELCNTITRKFGFSYTDAEACLIECGRNNIVHTNTSETISKACQLAQRYSFSFYDSLILAAAIACECDILYSEDLNDGQLIDNILMIRNPFKGL